MLLKIESNTSVFNSRTAAATSKLVNSLPSNLITSQSIGPRSYKYAVLLGPSPFVHVKSSRIGNTDQDFINQICIPTVEMIG